MVRIVINIFVVFAIHAVLVLRFRNIFAIVVTNGGHYITSDKSFCIDRKFARVDSAEAQFSAVLKNHVFRSVNADIDSVLLRVLVPFLPFAFGYSGSLLSIYGSQLGEEDLHLDVFAISVLKYPFYFILACGIIGFIYPFLTWKHRNETEKKFGLFLLASLIILIIGTSWIINRDEYNIALLHIRYMAMYIPLVLLFCFLPGEETAPESKKAKRYSVLRKDGKTWIV